MKANSKSRMEAHPVSSKMSPESLAEKSAQPAPTSDPLDGFRELGFIDSKGAEMLVHGSPMSIVLDDDSVC